MPRKNLTINLHPTLPFRSSRLAIPPSPFTPRAPLSPALTLPQSTIFTSSSSISKPSIVNLPQPPSTNPLHWIWQCHICARSYRLSVTRRCLDDGHFFCAGTTVVRRGRGASGVRKVRRHRACGSEFDYKGWKEWGSWRRQVVRLVMLAEAEAKAKTAGLDDDVEMVEAHDEHIFTESVVSPLSGSMAGEARNSTRWFKSRVPTTTPATPVRSARPDEGEKGKKDCWLECDYPSECRWGKAYGVASPVTPAFSFTTMSSDVPVAATTVSSADVEEENPGASTGFVFDVTADPAFVPDGVDEPIPAEMEVDEQKEERTAPPTDFRDILTPEQQNVVDTIDGVDVSPPSSPTSPFSAAVSASGTSSTTGQPAFTDLASLVESAQRRKSRTESQGSSPLSAQLDHTTTKKVKTMELPILTRTSQSSSSAPSSTSTSSSSSTAKSTMEQTILSKAFTDLEFDIKKSVERAGGLIAGVVGVVRGTTPATDSTFASAVATESEKNKKQTMKKEEGQGRRLRLGSKE